MDISDTTTDVDTSDNQVTIKGDSNFISTHLKQWLSQFEDPCFIADFPIIDAPMLIDLIADWNSKEIIKDGFDISDDWIRYKKQINIGLPKHLPNIRYDQFFDLHTIFWLKGIDTDINREEFAGIKNPNKHDSLSDCYTAWECYKKLMTIN